MADLDAVLDELIRDIPDWPEAGVTFRDVTPLLADPVGFSTAVEALARYGEQIAGEPVDKVVGIEARGFLFGTPVAVVQRAGFVPARKAGKLPWTTHAVTYDLEYGSATLEIHRDALNPGDRVLVVDDVLATGGTMAAAYDLVAAAGARPVAGVVVLELEALGGRVRLAERGMAQRLGSLRVI